VHGHTGAARERSERPFLEQQRLEYRLRGELSSLSVNLRLPSSGSAIIRSSSVDHSPRRQLGHGLIVDTICHDRQR
jgi:hypothetical protein